MHCNCSSKSSVVLKHNKNLSGSDSAAHKQLLSAIPYIPVGFAKHSGGTDREDTKRVPCFSIAAAGDQTGHVKEHEMASFSR